MSYIAKPLISIVIPTFNHANYLKKALESVLNQSFKNWEAIVVNNYSSDNTDDIITSFNDSRIKHLKVKNYGVIAKSRNFGILASKGEWIAFLDSDDWWNPEKLKICKDNFDHEVDLIYHDLEIVKKEKTFFKKKKFNTRKLKKPILIDLLVRGNTISNSSVIVRKKILNKIGLINEDRDLTAVEDYHTWLKISNFSNKFLYIPKKLGFYLVNNDSISRQDLSIPVRKATYEFSSILNRGQKLKLESYIKYLSGRFNFLNSNYRKAKKDLLFSLCYGEFLFKLKSLYMILIIVIKRLEKV